MAIAAGDAGIYSDDFEGAEWVSAQPPTSDVNWDFDELASSGTIDISSGAVVIDLPGGTTRTWYDSARACPVLRQGCTDADFEVTLKLADLPTTQGEEVYLYASNTDETEAYSAGFYYDTSFVRSATDHVGGSEPYGVASSLTAPCYLRLVWDTAANTLACWSSQDGTTWTSAYYTHTGLTTFVPLYVGVVVGTFNGNANVRTFDYFYEAAGEIGGAGPTRRVMVIS